ncbi:MAG TPA: DMT family transporter [Anaerolineae bacterium]|nr:DMT family transporter [Anaerolineae bacterium]
MKTKDWTLFWLLGLIWGTSFLWIKIAVGEVSPIVLVGFRTLFASVGLSIIVLANEKSRVGWRDIRKRLFDFAVLGTFNIAFPWLLISWAEQFIDSGLTAILNSTMPLFTILIAPIFISDDRITIPKVVGLITGFLGVVILMAPSIHSGWNNNLIAQAATLLAVLSYACATVYARKKGRGLPPQLQAFLQLSMGATIIWIFALFTEKPLVFPQQPLTWLALLWLGLLGSCLAYIGYFSLLHKIGPTRMSMVTYIPPLVGIILGVVFLDEQFHWQSIFGALLILSGISIVNLRKKAKEHLKGAEG